MKTRPKTNTYLIPNKHFDYLVTDKLIENISSQNIIAKLENID